jgi:phosphoglycerate dehydrogenase-like enzyme
MRAGACLINTARETLVDEAELRDALLRGHVGGAALDVVERPPAGQRHPLLDVPNVIVTPHIGGATEETLRRAAQQIAAAVAEFAAGRPPRSLVNPEVLSGRGAQS